jgi:hypothetical protein
VFAPIVSVPLMGTQNYFQNGEGDGKILIVLALLGLVFALARKFQILWATGIASLGILAFTFLNFQRGLGEMKRSMDVELAGNPFRGLADMAVQSVQLQWGWAVLIIGAGLMIASAISARTS